jgi:hypothetical protein
MNPVRFGAVYYFTPQKESDKTTLFQERSPAQVAAALMKVDDFSYLGGQFVAVDDENGEITIKTRTAENALGFSEDVRLLTKLADKLQGLLSGKESVADYELPENLTVRTAINSLLNSFKPDIDQTGWLASKTDDALEQKKLKKDQRTFQYSA